MTAEKLDLEELERKAKAAVGVDRASMSIGDLFAVAREVPALIARVKEAEAAQTTSADEPGINLLLAQINDLLSALGEERAVSEVNAAAFRGACDAASTLRERATAAGQYAEQITELTGRLASVEAERDRMRDALEEHAVVKAACGTLICNLCLQDVAGSRPHAPGCLLSTPAVGGGWRPTIRHKKRGTSYAVEPTRATLQTDVPLGDDQELVIYRGEDGRRWARTPAEMEDGRFEPLPKEPDNG